MMPMVWSSLVTFPYQMEVGTTSTSCISKACGEMLMSSGNAPEAFRYLEITDKPWLHGSYSQVTNYLVIFWICFLQLSILIGKIHGNTSSPNHSPNVWVKLQQLSQLDWELHVGGRNQEISSDLYSYPVLILYATKKLRCKLFRSKHISRCPPQEGCFGGLLCSHITRWEPPCFIPGVLGRFHRGGTLFLWTRSTRARAGLCTDPKHLKRGRSILTIDLNSHLRWRRSHFLKPATMLYLYKILLLMVYYPPSKIEMENVQLSMYFPSILIGRELSHNEQGCVLNLPVRI